MVIRGMYDLKSHPRKEVNRMRIISSCEECRFSGAIGHCDLAVCPEDYHSNQQGSNGMYIIPVGKPDWSEIRRGREVIED